MVEPLLVPDGEVLRMFHDGEGEADKAWRNQQLLICPEYEQQLDPVPQLLQTDQHHWVVRVAGHPILQLEERTILGEKNLFPVFAARLIQSLNAMLDPGGGISVNRARHD